MQLPITSTYAKTLGAATGFIGFIAGAYSFSNLFSNVFSDYLVDKTGPKKVLSIGFLVNGLVFFSYSLLQTPLQMFVVRLINGFTSGILTPAAFTYLTLYSKSKKAEKRWLLPQRCWSCHNFRTSVQRIIRQRQDIP